MNQNPLNMRINSNNIYINDSSIPEIIGQDQDYNTCSCPNFKSIYPTDYKIEEELFVNSYYFFQKNISIDNENIKENPNEKITKTIINEENDIPFKIKEENISFQKLNKESNKENINTQIKELKSDINKKNHLGRKRRNDCCNGEHNKYSEDNLRRKAKNLVLDYTMDFLNETIKNIYNGNIGEGMPIKKLFPLNRSFKCDTTIQHNRDILDNTLADIFSENISTRYSYYSPNHNSELIKRLLNEKDEFKRLYFKKIFNLTFLQCLKSFTGNDICDELKQLKKFSEIKSKFTDETEYINRLELYLIKFENIIKTKKKQEMKYYKNIKKNQKK